MSQQRLNFNQAIELEIEERYRNFSLPTKRENLIPYLTFQVFWKHLIEKWLMISVPTIDLVRKLESKVLQHESFDVYRYEGEIQFFVELHQSNPVFTSNLLQNLEAGSLRESVQRLIDGRTTNDFEKVDGLMMIAFGLGKIQFDGQRISSERLLDTKLILNHSNLILAEFHNDLMRLSIEPLAA